MADDVAILVENLGKTYTIGHRAENGRYIALRDVLARRIHDLWRTTKDLAQGKPIIEGDEIEEVWALKGIDFEIRQGEAVGVIGRNGAGKSTLLKILSRITAPSTGRVTITGRVASLLEVGTGFHPELTGRENIYLNGAILGMTRAEIRSKFDEIVAFAELERHLDTPVKRYSSGMYVRLAFAVAAHLEPEILLVDEVLAVGDAAFQKRCLGKMGDVTRGGRTVLFVSHNMPAVERLCERCLLLDNALLIADGPRQQVIETYLGSRTKTSGTQEWPEASEAPGDDSVRLKSIRIRDLTGNTVSIVDIRDPVGIEIEYWNLTARGRPSVGIHLSNLEGVRLFASQDFNNPAWYNTSPRPCGLIRATCWIPGNFLAEGKHAVTMTISSFSPVLLHHVVKYDILTFQVTDHSENDGVRGPTRAAWPGVVRPMLEWEVECLPRVSGTNTPSETGV